MAPRINPEEKRQFKQFWKNQQMQIKDKVSNQTLHWFKIYTEQNNVGYDYGQLRPGRLGQFDLFHYLLDLNFPNYDKEEALIASGLTEKDLVPQPNLKKDKK